MRTVLLPTIASLLLLAAAAPAQSAAGTVPVLVVTGANNHDWEWTAPELERMLEDTGRFDVDVTESPSATLADAEAIAGYDVFVLDYNGPRWGAAAERAFLDAVRGGTGVAVIHAANNAFPGWAAYEQLVGHCWREGTGHGRFHAFDVEVVQPEHPITAGMPEMVAHPDELYHDLVHMHDVDFDLLARAWSAEETGGSGEHEPMVVVKRFGAGRVFHTPLGHVWRDVPITRASFLDPRFRQLVARGVEWAATGGVSLPAEPPANVLLPSEERMGFRLLFDGESTDGWRGFRKEGFPEQGWVVEDGALRHRAGGGGGDLITTEEFGDFELRFEWAVAEGGNSGVIYHCTEEAETTWRTGPEYQVLDDGAEPSTADTSAAALYALAAPGVKFLRPPRHFNTGRIVVRGPRIEHWLNGVEVVEVRTDGEAWRRAVANSKFASMPGFARAERGHVALQDHGDEVAYRSLRIRELPPQ